jgi:hypothetical protein
MHIISVFSIGSHVGEMNDRRDEKRPSDFAYFSAAALLGLYINCHLGLRWKDALICAQEDTSPCSSHRSI